jgi:hypothetical protein
VGIRAKREPFLYRLTVQDVVPEKLVNKSTKRGKFPAFKRSAFSHHVSPRIHHNHTIKKPRSVPHFSQKPLQKHPSTTPINFSPVTIKKHRDRL